MNCFYQDLQHRLVINKQHWFWTFLCIRPKASPLPACHDHNSIWQFILLVQSILQNNIHNTARRINYRNLTNPKGAHHSIRSLNAVTLLNTAKISIHNVCNR